MKQKTKYKKTWKEFLKAKKPRRFCPDCNSPVSDRVNAQWWCNKCNKYCLHTKKHKG